MNLEELEKLLILMQKYGVKNFHNDKEGLSIEVVPVAPPVSQTPQTHYSEPQFKEPEMPMSMAMWGAKYNG